MKNLKVISYLIIVLVVVTMGVTIYVKATQVSEEDEKEKALSEIKYLDTKLVNLFNEMNNISMKNYKVYTSKIEDIETQNSSSISSESKSEGESSKGSSNTTNNENRESNQKNKNKDNIKNYEMKPEVILTNNDEIDWNKVKNEIELIYISIPTITLDLYKLNVDQDELLNFNKQFDNLTVLAKSQNKQETLKELSTIYQYIPKFAENITDDNVYKTVLKTKETVFRAYSKLDSKDWESIAKDIKNGTNLFSELLKSNVDNISNQASINEAYVMLNELLNAVNIKDETVFLIKYKNLLEQINNM